MSDTRKQRLEFLLRKNSGKHLLEIFKEEISKIVDPNEVTFTTLEQRDELWEKFCLLLDEDPSNYTIELLNQSDEVNFNKIFLRLGNLIDRQSVFVHFSRKYYDRHDYNNGCFRTTKSIDYDNIGSMKIDNILLFKNIFSFLKVDNDCYNKIYIMSTDLKNGMIVNVVPDDFDLNENLQSGQVIITDYPDQSISNSPENARSLCYSIKVYGQEWSTYFTEIDLNEQDHGSTISQKVQKITMSFINSLIRLFGSSKI